MSFRNHGFTVLARKSHTTQNIKF
ncbi:DUF321 domain-containing protein [Leptospira adleri]|nr:DUF321 domain-containing protein [Leptospira adleri]